MKSTAPSRAAKAAASGLGICLVLSLAGCASDGTTYGTTTGAPTTGVYVVQNTAASTTVAASGSILEFSASASGAATPVSVIANSNVSSLALLTIDGSGNLYTTSTQSTPGQTAATSSVVEYPVGSTNNVQPIRTLPFNSTTQLNALNGLAADPMGGIYAPEDSGGVAIFSPTATGSVAPNGYILGDTQTGGGLSTLVATTAAATDAKGHLYVVNNGTGVANPIVVFSTTTTGNAAPIRSIGGALTMIAAGTPQAIATDSAGNLYVANVVAGVSSILVFDPAATGNTAPLRDITGTSTQLGCVGGIAVDTESSFVYVVSTPTCGSTANPTVLKFSTVGTGDIAPVSSFTSTAWTNADAKLSVAVY